MATVAIAELFLMQKNFFYKKNENFRRSICLKILDISGVCLYRFRFFTPGFCNAGGEGHEDSTWRALDRTKNINKNDLSVFNPGPPHTQHGIWPNFILWA